MWTCVPFVCPGLCDLNWMCFDFVKLGEKSEKRNSLCGKTMWKRLLFVLCFAFFLLVCYCFVLFVYLFCWFVTVLFVHCYFLKRTVANMLLVFMFIFQEYWRGLCLSNLHVVISLCLCNHSTYIFLHGVHEHQSCYWLITCFTWNTWASMFVPYTETECTKK